jgi:hypothetical protein
MEPPKKRLTTVKVIEKMYPCLLNEGKVFVRLRKAGRSVEREKWTPQDDEFLEEILRSKVRE